LNDEHLHVELSESGWRSARRSSVAKTLDDLKIAIEAADHKNLLNNCGDAAAHKLAVVDPARH